jgi:hypothetical protein
MPLNPTAPLSQLSQIGDSLSSTAQVAAAMATGQDPTAPLKSGSSSLTQYVIIGLGLLLIAAGLFSFDKTRDLIVTAGKTAAKSAAVAA